MNKAITVVSGLILGLISVLFLAPLFQGFIANLLLNNASIVTENIHLSVQFPVEEGVSIFTYSIVFLSLLFATIIFIEISSYFISTSPSESVRSILIIFNLVNLGFIIYSIIASIFFVLFENSFDNNFIKVLNLSGFSYIQKLIVALFILLIFFSYISFSTNRLRKLIPRIQQQKSDKKTR